MEESKILKSDGTTENIVPNNGKSFTLEELQRIVAGYIEIVYLSGKDIMVINEEGKLNQMPVNLNATKIFQDFYRTTDYIVGDVLLTSRKLMG